MPKTQHNMADLRVARYRVVIERKVSINVVSTCFNERHLVQRSSITIVSTSNQIWLCGVVKARSVQFVFLTFFSLINVGVTSFPRWIDVISTFNRRHFPTAWQVSDYHSLVRPNYTRRLVACDCHFGVCKWAKQRFISNYRDMIGWIRLNSRSQLDLIHQNDNRMRQVASYNSALTPDDFTCQGKSSRREKCKKNFIEKMLQRSPHQFRWKVARRNMLQGHVLRTNVLQGVSKKRNT